MGSRSKLAELLLPESVRGSSTEANGAGWSLTYDCFFYSSAAMESSFTPTTANPNPSGFLLRVQSFHVLDPLYMPLRNPLALNSISQLHHFPSSHFSSSSAIHSFVISTLDSLGAPTTDPDPLAHLIFSFTRRHRAASASAVVPFYISFTITTVLHSVEEAVDWIHGGTPESQIVRTLRSTYDAISKLKNESFLLVRGERCSNCMVCLEGFEEDDDDEIRIVSRLPCSHLYHFECISRWLRFDHRCPVCRTPMPWVRTLLLKATDDQDQPQVQIQDIVVAPAAGSFTRLGLFFKQLFTNLFSNYLLK